MKISHSRVIQEMTEVLHSRQFDMKNAKISHIKPFWKRDKYSADEENFILLSNNKIDTLNFTVAKCELISCGSKISECI